MPTNDSSEGMRDCYVCKRRLKVGDLIQKAYVIRKIKGRGICAWWERFMSGPTGTTGDLVPVHHKCGFTR